MTIAPLDLVLASLGGLALALLAQNHLSLRAALRRRPSRPGPPREAPSVTVIRPVRGLDVGASENVRALLQLEYEGELELLFVLDGEEDPAAPLIRALVGTVPTRARRVDVLIAGPPPPGRTGKLNAMILGVAHARGTLLAFNDSDTRPEPKLLSSLVSALEADPRAGATFAPVYTQADRPRAGDVGYGLLVNAWYGPSVIRAAGPGGAMPFIMGQLMVFRRAALEAIGGVESAEGQFVDDMFLGKRLAAAGWRNLVVQAPLRIVTGGMDLGAFLRTFRRWILFSESGLPFAFTWPNWVRGVACWMAWGALVGGLLGGAPAPVLLGVVAIGFSVFSQVRLQRACHGPAISVRHLWVPAVLPLLAAGVTLSARVSRRVDWRGRSYDLDDGARLGAGGSAAVDR